MREIKFKVWDEHCKLLAGPEGLSLSVRNGVIDHVSHRTTNGYSTTEWGSAAHPLDQERYKVMQFAGRTDKNGVEIYEGDVVIFEDEFTEVIDPTLGGPTYTENQVATVEFRNGTFGVSVRDKSDFLEKGFVGFEWMVRYIGLMEYEVIGNVFENPELVSLSTATTRGTRPDGTQTE